MLKTFFYFITGFILSTSANISLAQKTTNLEVQAVTDKVYALVGEMGQRSPENLGNNSTHGFVILNTGILLIDSGGSYQGAQAIETAIRTISDKPIKWVINTGEQDHRWLGNGYFKQKGATLYASEKAVQAHQRLCQNKLSRMEQFIGQDKLKGTQCHYADQVFQSKKILKLDNTTFELYHSGPAHTKGNAYVWMPETKTVFVGDMVYNDRMLGVQYTKDVKGWIHTFESMSALKPKWVVPGHGYAGNLAKAKNDTYDYLVLLRDRLTAVVDDGGDMMMAKKIDQSPFDYLIGFDDLAVKNALWAFETLEFE